MARKSRSADQQARFLTTGRTRRFARIYSDMFESPAYMDLGSTAKEVYTAIVLALEGKPECTYPYSAYSKRFSKSGFHDAVLQLEDHGFITVTRYKRSANQFRLSEKWKEWSLPP